MTERTLNDLIEEMVAEMPTKLDLIYVDRNDQLTDKQVSALVAGDMDTFWSEISEFESESLNYGMDYAVEELIHTVIKEWEYNDDEDYSELRAEFEGDTNAVDTIRSTMAERESGDWLRQLIRRTPDPLLRVTAIDEDHGFAFQEVTAEQVLERVNIEATPENLATIADALRECSPEYSVLMGYWIFSVDLESLYDMSYDVEHVEVTDPHLYLGNPFAGSGWVTERPLIGKVKIPRADLRTDKGAFGYSIDDIYGGVRASAYSSPITAAMEVSA